MEEVNYFGEFLKETLGQNNRKNLIGALVLAVEDTEKYQAIEVLVKTAIHDSFYRNGLIPVKHTNKGNMALFPNVWVRGVKTVKGKISYDTFDDTAIRSVVESIMDMDYAEFLTRILPDNTDVGGLPKKLGVFAISTLAKMRKNAADNILLDSIRIGIIQYGIEDTLMAVSNPTIWYHTQTLARKIMARAISAEYVDGSNLVVSLNDYNNNPQWLKLVSLIVINDVLKHDFNTSVDTDMEEIEE